MRCGLRLPLSPTAGTVPDTDTYLAAIERDSARIAELVERSPDAVVPGCDGWTLTDLAAHWKLPLLVVARLGLGTINHTLLTVRHARSLGLKVAGVILNDSCGDGGVDAETNPDVLRALLEKTPLLGVMPRVDAKSAKGDPEALALAAETIAAAIVGP